MPVQLLNYFPIALVALSFFCSNTSAQDDPPPISWETIENRLTWEVENGFAGVVLVAREGKVVFHQAYGMANRDKKIPMKPDTILGIGSTPIDFTKAGILLLAERGKLSLTDPITKYFDNVPEDKRTITLQHLMTGRSGLQDFHDIRTDRDPDHSWIDRAEAVRRIFNQKLLFKPGQGRKHSHSAWGLLAAVIEIVSKQTYPEFTREHLFTPAGMKDTAFFGEEYAQDRMAIGYGPKTDGEINAPPYWGKTSWLVMGSGGQVSTALDMWRWTQAVRNGKILAPESVKLYAGPGQGMLTGGDMYGYEIMYAGDDRNFMVVISNNGSPRRNLQLRALGQALTTLVTGRAPAKFTLGIEMDVQEGRSVKIQDVVPGSAAERAGLQKGDVLVKIAGKPAGDQPIVQLWPFLETGDAVELEIQRDGQNLKVSVKPAPRK